MATRAVWGFVRGELVSSKASENSLLGRTARIEVAPLLAPTILGSGTPWITGRNCFTTWVVTTRLVAISVTSTSESNFRPEGCSITVPAITDEGEGHHKRRQGKLHLGPARKNGKPASAGLTHDKSESRTCPLR